MPLRSGFVFAAVLLVAAGCELSPPKPPAAKADVVVDIVEPIVPQVDPSPVTGTEKPQQRLPQSALYEQFDAAMLKEKYAPQFKSNSSIGSAEGLIVNATNEIFKTVQLQGVISDEQFQQVIEAVQADLDELAKSSSVKITNEPNSDLKGRPEWLLNLYFKDIAPESLRGSYFTYSQGSIQGTVEILSKATTDGKKPGWKLIVNLHETSQVK